MALLVEAAPSGGVNSKWEGRLIFADGSDKVVTIEKKWDDKDDGKAIQEFHEGTAENPNIALSGGGANVYAAPMLVSYEVSNNVYTLTRMGLTNTDTKDTTPETNGYDTYISGKSGTTDGSIKATLTSTDGASVSRLYYESTGIVFVKYSDKGTGGVSDASYKVVSGKTASDYDRTVSAVQAVADKSGNNYYAQAAFIDLGSYSTGGNSDDYAVVIANVEKRTGTANGTVYVITAWNGSETITVTTDDSAADKLEKGSIFSYTGTGDTLADIDTFSDAKEGNYYVQAFDATSGDITLMTFDKNNTASVVGKDSSGNVYDAWSVVDSKDTTVLFVNSDAGEGVTGYDLNDIALSFVFDEDYWSKGYVPEKFEIVDGVLCDKDNHDNKLTEDFAPSVRVYVDNDSDDQITVLVVDINRNINEW